MSTSDMDRWTEEWLSFKAQFLTKLFIKYDFGDKILSNIRWITEIGTHLSLDRRPEIGEVIKYYPDSSRRLHHYIRSYGYVSFHELKDIWD